MRIRKTKAFTLIEMLVVVVIIGILAALVVLALRSASGRAKDARAKTAVRSVQTALESLVTSGTDLTTALGTGVVTDTKLKNLSDGTTKLFASAPLDAKGNQIKVKVVSKDEYQIEGESTNSTTGTKRCWFINNTSALVNDDLATTSAACPF